MVTYLYEQLLTFRMILTQGEEETKQLNIYFFSVTYLTPHKDSLFSNALKMTKQMVKTALRLREQELDIRFKLKQELCRGKFSTEFFFLTNH